VESRGSVWVASETCETWSSLD